MYEGVFFLYSTPNLLTRRLPLVQTNVTSIDFGKLQEADGGVQLLVTGIGSGPNVQANLKYAENLVIEGETS